MQGWRILLWAVLVIALLSFLYMVRGILLPFMLSFIVAALLDPTVRKLRIRGLSRMASVWIVVGPFYVLMILVGVLVTPSIVGEATSLTQKAQDVTIFLQETSASDNFFINWNPVVQSEQGATTEKIDRILASYTPTLERLGLPSTRRAIMEQYVEPQRPRIAKAIEGVFNSFFGFVTNLFSQMLFIMMIFILVPLFLLEMDDIRKRGPKWIPPAFRASAVSMMGDIGQVFVRYLRGIATVVLLYTVAQSILLWASGVPYWILIGPFFGALYLVPYLGNIISAVTLFSIIGMGNVTGGLIHPTTNPWAYAAMVTVFYLVIAFSFDHLIYPQMVGNSVGLSPVVSMFVIFCGGALFGLPGMLIAFPLAGSVKVILDRLLAITSGSQDALHLPAVPMRHRAT